MVSSIDAELLSGTFTCLVGRNGSGKSTLLKTIAHLIKPLEGTMKGGKSVGIVLTSFPSLQNTTVYELISYGRIPYQDLIATLSATDREAIDTAIETVGIGDFK